MAGRPDVDITALTGLRESLARLYPAVDMSRRIVEQAGLDPISIGFETNARTNWFKILDEARKHDGRTDAIVEQALAEYPTNEVLGLWKRGVAPPPVLEGRPPADWQGPRSAAMLEKLLQPVSSLVPISHLELGLVRARAVARILRADGESGTGFLTPGDILVTNHHVLPDAETARGAVAMFNFQAALSGLPLEADRRTLLPDDLFRSSEGADWSVVKVAGNPSERWSALELGSAAVKTGDRVNIIQHPYGQLKQISWFSNVVVYVGGGVVQYLTDTEPGSSGAPVFDRDWKVVAVHHSGGWLTEPEAGDTTKEYYRNEGILIDRVIEGLQ